MDEKEYPAASEQKSASELMKEEYLRSKERTEQLLREYKEQKRKEELAKIIQVPRTTNQPEQSGEKSRKPKKNWLIAASLVLVLLVGILIPVLSSLNHWETKNGNTYFVVDGENATGWWDIGNDRYYFGNNGIMRTGWVKINGASYYFGSDGVMRTGWQTIDNNRYFFTTNGKMCTGWWDIGSGRYYFGNNGIMRTGKQTINGTTYYFDADGRLIE